MLRLMPIEIDAARTRTVGPTSGPGGPHESFTTAAWEDTSDLRAAVHDLGFLRRLGDGTLPTDAFAYYIEQDALYLAGYARALALVAASAPDAEAASFWATSAATAATEESALHRDLLASGRLPIADGPVEASPTCLGYVSYLVATAATASYAVAAAAVLPCFWIYSDVGADLARRARDILAAEPDHPYARWVATYDDPAFHESTARARALVDAAAAAATDAERTAMHTAFTIAMRYELMFWDTALHRSPWPDPPRSDAAAAGGAR